MEISPNEEVKRELTAEQKAEIGDATEEYCKHPATIPGLFSFRRNFNGGFDVELEPELWQKRADLMTKSDIQEQELAWALEGASSIDTKRLEYLVEENGYALFRMSDDDLEAALIEGGLKDAEPNVNSVLEMKSHKNLFVMAQCCRYILTIQRSIGNEIRRLTDKITAQEELEAAEREVAEREAAVRAAAERIAAERVAAERVTANLAVKHKFNKAMDFFNNQIGPHLNARCVTLKKGELSQRIPLTVAAIDSAQKLAGRTLCIPFRGDVKEDLEKQYKDELVTYRDKANRRAINWSEVFSYAGLQKLPTGRTEESPAS